MEYVEDYIMAILVQKGKINQPLTCKEGLMFANNLIEGASIERRVIAYKKKWNCYKYRIVKNVELEAKYWSNVLTQSW